MPRWSYIFVLKGGTLYPHKNCNDWVNQIKLDELTVLLLDQLDMKFPGILGHGLSGLG